MLKLLKFENKRLMNVSKRRGLYSGIHRLTRDRTCVVSIKRLDFKSVELERDLD